MERQWVCYDLHFFWQILNKHLGKALNFSWKIPPVSSRSAARSCRSRAVSAAASGNCSSLRVPARHRSCRNSFNPSGWEPGRGLWPLVPQLLPPIKSQMRLWRRVVAAVGDQQSPALLLLPESLRFLPKSSLGALLGTPQLLP